MMHVTKGLFLFSTRACLFMLAHVIFYYGPARGSSELQLLNSIAITSACLLAITVAWLAWEVGKKVCCISPFDLVQQNCASDRDNEELSDNDDDTTTILQRADAADNNNNNTREEEEEEHPVVHLSRVTTRRLHVTPWILWYYAHAAGVSVFIMAYSISALSSLPSVSVIAAISACTVLGGGDGDSALLELAAWPFCMIVALSLFCADLMLEVGIDAWVQAFASNMWMGCVMPAGACVFLFRVIRRVRCARLTPYEMISFTLPSLAMLSASFLSIYMPWASLAASAGVQNTTSSSLESLTLLYSYYFNSSHYAASHSADNNSNNNNSGSLVLGSSSSTLGDQVAAYMRDHPLFFFHDNRSQNQNYYTNYDTADDGSTSMLASITLSLLCPPVLFALLIIFLSSFTALSDHSTKSNASAFALSNIMRRFFFTLSTNKLVRVFSLLFVLGAAAVVIVARAVRELDDNDEEQQQQGSSNDTNNMSTFQPATSSENSMVETPAT